MLKVAITGHKLERIRGQERKIKEWLSEQIGNLVKQYKDVVILDGMADGVDQIAAFVALEQGAAVSCYFPYKEKMSRSQLYISEKAMEIKYISQEFFEECFTKRDRKMIDDCDMVIVVWDGKIGGGTYSTYQYALEKNKKILLYPNF